MIDSQRLSVVFQRIRFISVHIAEGGERSSFPSPTLLLVEFLYLLLGEELPDLLLMELLYPLLEFLYLLLTE